MTIVWGHNNFRLKAVPPEEIGMFNRELTGYTFELRQKYGHLFWIPFIPLGKFWVIKKPDGKLYHCPADIEAQLEQRYPIRTSLWAWTGPLLIIGGMIIFSISEKVHEYNWKKEAKESYAAAATSLTDRIKNTRAGDYLLLQVKQPGNNYYDYNKVPLKVLSVHNDELTVARISAQYKDGESKGIVSNVREEQDNYNSEDDIAGMEFKYGIKDSFVISKTALRQAVCTDNLGEGKFDGISIKEFSGTGHCMLKNIVHVEGPVLKLVDLAPEKKDGKYYEIKNVGFNVHADSLVAYSKGEPWQISKERQFYYGDIIAIKCNTKDSAILYTSDYKKRVYKNKIDNTGYSIQCSSLTE
ncbi:hypothetical protein [Ferruginibacter sp.]